MKKKFILVAVLILAVTAGFILAVTLINRKPENRIVGTWEVGEEADNLPDLPKFTEPFDEDTSVFLVFDKDGTFFCMELGFMALTGNWKFMGNDYLSLEVDGEKLVMQITFKTNDSAVIHESYSDSYQRWRRIK